MAFRLAPCALILLLLYSLTTTVNAATSQPPTSVRFYTDSNCKSLFATVQTAANVGNGQCGNLPAGISSASAEFLDDGCYLTIYTDDCDAGATAVRLNDCTALSAASFSIDCPGINGTYDPGYTTLTAEGTPSTTSATPVTFPTDEAEASPVPQESTTAPKQEPSSVTIIPDPSPAHNPSSTPSSFTTTPTSTPATLSPESQSSTTPSLTTRSPTSPSASRNSQTSPQPSSSSSSSTSSPPSSTSPSPLPSPSSTQAQQKTDNNGSLNGHNLIFALVFSIVALIAIVALILGIWWIKHSKKPPPSRKEEEEESENTSKNPTSNHLHYPSQPSAELDGPRGGELDGSPTDHHELGSKEVYEMAARKPGRSKKEKGIQELNGDVQHPRELS
ncbi:hypothetical protein BDR22DRAFT_893680 [Usnea florida]